MLKAALLGLIQALTEFLPVSSSGHLRIANAMLGFEADHDLLFDIVLHVGTLLAVVLVYHQRILFLLGGVARGLAGVAKNGLSAVREHEGLRYLVLIIIATIPTGIMGVLLSDVMDSEFFSTPVVGGLLLLNGVILRVSKRFSDASEGRSENGDGSSGTGAWSIGGIGPREALLIGIAQGIAVCPGISRSGSTIVCALALGAPRMKAAEFSFFLSIPAILGAVVLMLDFDAISASGHAGVYLVGAAVSAGVGVLALRLLLGVVRAAQLHRFAWYCWALDVVAIAWSALN